MAVLIAVAICLAACLRQAPPSGPPELSTLDMDVAKFLQFTFLDEVAISAAEIRTDQGRSTRTRRVALEYMEHENWKGYVPVREVEYTNLYLASQVERIGDDRETIKDRYLVINLWHYYPSRGVKTCHVWVIWDGELHATPPRASFRLLVEDFNNTFLGERQERLDSRTVEQLAEFYGRAQDFLSKRVKDFPIAAALTLGKRVSIEMGLPRPQRPALSIHSSNPS